MNEGRLVFSQVIDLLHREQFDRVLVQTANRDWR